MTEDSSLNGINLSQVLITDEDGFERAPEEDQDEYDEPQMRKNALAFSYDNRQVKRQGNA